MIKFFYGMSGSFKGLTITAEGNAPIVKSMIKTWKDLSGSIFNGNLSENHLNFALLHLCILSHEVGSNDCGNLIVERGVSDPFFYYTRGKIYGRDTESEIYRAVDEELEIVKGLGEVQKILLANKDRNFIRDVVLSEPHRAQVFPGGVDEYLMEQEKYIAFTSRFNKITDVREISNARDYIEGLGFEYKV